MIAQKDYARLRKGERIYHFCAYCWAEKLAQLYFYYSAMNAGKSTALLQSSYNYQERGMRTVVYTAEIDDRFGAGKVSSRIGLSSPAKLFNQNSSLFDEIRAEHEQQAIHCVRYTRTLLWFTYRFSRWIIYWQSILTGVVRQTGWIKNHLFLWP